MSILQKLEQENYKFKFSHGLYSRALSLKKEGKKVGREEKREAARVSAVPKFLMKSTGMPGLADPGIIGPGAAPRQPCWLQTDSRLASR